MLCCGLASLPLGLPAVRLTFVYSGLRLGWIVVNLVCCEAGLRLILDAVKLDCQ